MRPTRCYSRQNVGNPGTGRACSGHRSSDSCERVSRMPPLTPVGSAFASGVPGDASCRDVTRLRQRLQRFGMGREPAFWDALLAPTGTWRFRLVVRGTPILEGRYARPLPRPIGHLAISCPRSRRRIYGHPPGEFNKVTSTGGLIAVPPPAWVTTLWKT